MTRKELVDTVAEKLNIMSESAESAVLTTMETIAYGLASTGSVVIPNFGTFIVKERAARKGRVPRTGEEIMIPVKKLVKFKPCKVLKETVQ